MAGSGLNHKSATKVGVTQQSAPKLKQFCKRGEKVIGRQDTEEKAEDGRGVKKEMGPLSGTVIQSGRGVWVNQDQERVKRGAS